MKRDLHIVVCVLNEIKSHVVAGDASLASLQPLIYVPVHCDARDTLKMAPLAECSYGDDEWLKQGSVLFFSRPIEYYNHLTAFFQDNLGEPVPER